MSSAIEGGFYTADPRNLYTPDQARMQDWTVAGGTYVPTSTSSYTFNGPRSISPTTMVSYMAENVSYGFGIAKVGGTGTVNLTVEIYNSVTSVTVASATTERATNGRLFVTIKTPDTAPTQLDYLKARVIVTSSAAGIVVQEPTFTLGTKDLGPLPPLFTLYIGQFAIRVVLYTPNGARQKILTAANNIEVSFPLSDVGALMFSYNKKLPEWKILSAQHCEVAVEYSINGFNWSEPPGARFYRSKMEDDDSEPVGETKFSFVSWGWFMRRLVVLNDPADPVASKGYLIVDDRRSPDPQDTLRFTAARGGSWSSRLSMTFAEGNTATAFTIDVFLDDVRVHHYLNYVSYETLVSDMNASPYIRCQNLGSTSTYPSNLPSNGKRINLSAGKDDREFAGLTPGALLKKIIDEEHADGVMTALTYDFTATVDSSGTAWSSDLVTASYPAGTSLLDIMSDLVDSGYVEWTTNGRMLRMFRADGTLKNDRSASVIYKLGYEITTARNAITNDELMTRITVFSGGGYSNVIRTNPATPYGHFETVVNQSGITSTGVLDMISKNAMDHGLKLKRQMTRSIDWKNTSRLPFNDFLPGDFIGLVTSSPYADIPEIDGERVIQITLQVSEKEGLTGNLVLNTRREEALISYARKTNKTLLGLKKT